jgi:glutamine cyclotransferase
MRKREAIGLVVILTVMSIYVYQTYFSRPELASIYTFHVENKYPHDPAAFTQGLVYYNGRFYEGTGLYGESSLRIIDPTTGEIVGRVNISEKYFGEGITILGEYVYQLTWKGHIGFVYDIELNLVSNFSIPREGWGLTHNGTHLVLSDGTSTISYIDPTTLKIIDTLNVTYDGKEVTMINELEYFDGYIYANIWQTDMIAIIEPATGEVASWIDLTGLQNQLDSTTGIDALNGIAYDPDTGKVFVTGKLWPNLFEIKLIPN